MHHNSTTISEAFCYSCYMEGVRKEKSCKSWNPTGPPPRSLPRNVQHCKSFSCMLSIKPQQNQNINYATEIGVREAKEEASDQNAGSALAKGFFSSSQKRSHFPSPHSSSMKTSSCSNAAGELQEEQTTYKCAEELEYFDNCSLLIWKLLLMRTLTSTQTRTQQEPNLGECRHQLETEQM